MHDVDVIRVRSKDAQKQLARTSLSGYEPPNLENGSLLTSDNFDDTDLRSV